MNKAEVRRVRLNINRLNLIGKEYLNVPTKIIMENCNGVGPEFFPKKIRKFITECNPTLKLSSVIHDMMWACGYDFTRSNDILYLNGKWEAKAAYKWYNPLRYLAIFRAWRFARLCQKFGYYAWVQAKKKGCK